MEKNEKQVQYITSFIYHLTILTLLTQVTVNNHSSSKIFRDNGDMLKGLIQSMMIIIFTSGNYCFTACV